MVVNLPPELEAALVEAARRKGLPPETLAVRALRERFLSASKPLEPRDEWEQGLVEAARVCGVSLSDAALSSDGLYE